MSEIFEKLWKLKADRQWWSKVITARVKQDCKMSVWNGIHPPEENTTEHVCKAGTRVRVWMVSRFGDVGITDNLDEPHGYDARVEPDILEDLHIEDASPPKHDVTVVVDKNSFFMAVLPPGRKE